MKLLSQIKKIALFACVIFTALITLVYTVSAFVSSYLVPTPAMFYSLLGFSLVLSALNAFLFSDALVFALRLILHYAASAAMFYLLFVVVSGYKENGGSVLVVMLLYTAVYAVFALITALANHKRTKPKKEKTEYKKVF